MKPITLVLTSPRGDKIGELPLSEVVVAGAGESGAAERPCLAGDMDALQERIQEALAGEGLEVCLDAIDCRIGISRSLLQDSPGEAVRIVLPIRELPAGTDPAPDSPAATGSDSPLTLMDDLFRLDDTEEGDREEHA